MWCLVGDPEWLCRLGASGTPEGGKEGRRGREGGKGGRRGREGGKEREGRREGDRWGRERGDKDT